MSGGRLRIVVDVAERRLHGELVELLERAGHLVERGAATAERPFDVALVATAELAERLRRARPHDAIVVVTEVDDVPERIRALAAGADDAFDRGFAGSQAVARIGAAGRRAAAAVRGGEVVQADGCVIDLAAATVTRDGNCRPLTAREVDLVRWMSRHAGRVISRGELLRTVWRVAATNQTRAVDVAVAGLRAKIERDPANPAIIRSLRGVGYQWATDILTVR